MWDTVWIDTNLATMAEDNDLPYGMIKDGALAATQGRINWIGSRNDLPGRPEELAKTVIALDGQWMTPGLIDCHTHIVYAGNRAAEFEMRLKGATYEEIARSGGGIISTVQATRHASEMDLFAAASRRIADLISEGVTTVEIKSGYGLDTATELKMLRTAKRLETELPMRISTTFLGAHALPPEYKDRADDYIDLVCDEMIPAVAALGLADAVDGFCENIGFSSTQMSLVFEAAKRQNLPVKLHAEQLSDQGGAQLLARFEGLSADHLEYVSEEGVRAMSQSGAVAVLLPGAYYFLRETQLPPIDLFRKYKVPIAISTDCNPGSSPATSLLLMLNMGCTLFRLTPEECLAAVTREAANALGLGHDRGTLAIGKNADLAIWDIDLPAELAYRIGANPCTSVVLGGEVR